MNLHTHTHTVVTGTSITLNPENRNNFSFLTEPINVTVKVNDQLQLFTMASNSVRGRSIQVTFGNSNNNISIRTKHDHPNITYDVEQRVKCEPDCIYVLLMTVTLNNETLQRFISISSSVDGARLVPFRYKFCTRALCESEAYYASKTSYIELIADSEADPGPCDTPPDRNTTETENPTTITTGNIAITTHNTSELVGTNTTGHSNAVTFGIMHSNAIMYVSVFLNLALIIN